MPSALPNRVAGIPFLDASGKITTGNQYFVSSDTGADSTGNDGSIRRPFATIDYAVGRCSANVGDVIYVMPGHTETVSAAAGINLDVAGISVIGLGAGGSAGRAADWHRWRWPRPPAAQSG